MQIFLSELKDIDNAKNDFILSYPLDMILQNPAELKTYTINLINRLEKTIQ